MPRDCDGRKEIKIIIQGESSINFCRCKGDSDSAEFRMHSQEYLQAHISFVANTHTLLEHTFTLCNEEDSSNSTGREERAAVLHGHDKV